METKNEKELQKNKIKTNKDIKEQREQKLQLREDERMRAN